LVIVLTGKYSTNYNLNGTNTEAVVEVIFAGMIGASVIFSIEKSFDSLDRSINPLITYLEGLAP